MQKILQAGIQKNIGKSIRAEDLDSWFNMLVQPISLSQLQTNSNQIIFGRRGSGKTMYLKALAEMLGGNLPKYRVLAIYTCVNEFLVSPDDSPTTYTPLQKGHHCFLSFITSLGDQLFKYYDIISNDPQLIQTLGLTKKSLHALQDTLLELRYIQSHGDASRSKPKGSGTIIRSNSGKKERTNEKVSKLGLTLESKKMEMSVTASGSSNNRTIKTESMELQAKTEFGLVIPTHIIRSLAKTLVEQFKVDTLMIMIDEWPLLQDGQADFAEYLRRSFFGEKELSIKIAADRYMCTLSGVTNGKIRGLELGADIFEIADLDLPLHNTDDSLPLYAEMLAKRLVNFAPELYNFFGVNILQSPMIVVDSLFHNQRAFAELCNGAQGLAREFLSLFAQCSEALAYDTSKKITYEKIHKVLLKDSRGTVSNVETDPIALAALIGVRDLVRKNRSPFFFTQKNAVNKSNSLRALVTKRAVHRLPFRSIDFKVSQAYDCYEIDYSIFIEWVDLMEWSNTVKPIGDMRRALPRIELSEASKYYLEFQDHYAESIVCSVCHVPFFASDSSFVLKKLCPHCFEQPIIAK